MVGDRVLFPDHAWGTALELEPGQQVDGLRVVCIISKLAVCLSRVQSRRMRDE